MFRFILVATAAVVVLVLPGRALAAPGNDAFASATSIGSLPFAETLDLDGASIEPGEPQTCNFQSQSVWYRLAPSVATPVRIDLAGSEFGVVLSVYRSFGTGISGLNFGGCTGFGGSVQLTAEAGSVWYIQAGSVSSGSATLSLQVEPIPPPANDDFAAATAVGALPYVDSVDLTAATVETGEPLSPPGVFPPLSGSAWYTFSPGASASYTLTTLGCCASTYLTPYTGSAVDGLASVAATSGSGRTTFQALAGETYRIQLGRGNTFGGSASGGIQVEETPPVSMAFSLSPFDPSVFDTIQFFNASFDPIAAGFVSVLWDFGDGTTGSGQSVSHSYASDGDYTVRLDVETADGRTGSTTRVVDVRTHDVGIAKLTVPQSASVGHTRSIVVGLSNHRRPERVRVTLLRSTPGGAFEFVGSNVLDVPVLGGNRTLPVELAYTFGAADALAGKVTFRALAQIEGARDALPADNDVMALPTRVR